MQEEDLVALVERDMKGWRHEDVVEYIANLLSLLSKHDPQVRGRLVADIKEMKDNE